MAMSQDPLLDLMTRGVIIQSVEGVIKETVVMDIIIH